VKEIYTVGLHQYNIYYIKKVKHKTKIMTWHATNYDNRNDDHNYSIRTNFLLISLKITYFCVKMTIIEIACRLWLNIRITFGVNMTCTPRSVCLRS